MTATRKGRPALTSFYIDAIDATPEGEVAVMGMVHTGEAFASYQAAQHHQRSILARLGPVEEGAVTILPVKDAIEIIDYSAKRGRYLTSLHNGYYLVLKGRG